MTAFFGAGQVALLLLRAGADFSATDVSWGSHFFFPLGLSFLTLFFFPIPFFFLIVNPSHRMRSGANSLLYVFYESVTLSTQLQRMTPEERGLERGHRDLAMHFRLWAQVLCVMIGCLQKMSCPVNTSISFPQTR